MNAQTSYALIAILAVVGTVSLMPTVVASEHPNLDLHEPCPECVGDSAEQAMIVEQREVPLTLWTDSAAYGHDSVITVEGKVANVKQGWPVTIQVISPTASLVTVKQVNIDNNKEFSATLNTAGNLWKYDGTYTIIAQYGSGEGASNKVLVELTGGEKFVPRTPPSTVTCGASELTASDQCIPYSITGGTISSATIDVDSKSIVVMINSENGGELTLSPTTETARELHTVLVDGEEWDDVIIDGNSVTVMFLAGAEKIEVFGAYVVPEFGTIAALILAVAIISIIAVTSRSRLSVMPKF